MEEPLNALFADIQGQPQSLEQVIAHQLGDGAAAVARAAAEIRHARHLMFSGMGGSLFAAMPAAAMLNARGRTCVAMEAAEALYYHDAHDRGTLAVLVSRSGETVEVVKLLPKLHKRGVRVIGVTNVKDSTLARTADITIFVDSAPDKMVALRTYTGTVSALLMMASAASGAALPDLKRLPRAMNEIIDREFAAAAVTWPDHPRIYLLGRGASLGSVHEGALLFHESARMPAVPMAAAQFRHGAVEAVSPAVCAFVFASQAETRDLDVRLGADLQQLGAQVRLIEEREFAGAWATVLEVIPIQITAARLSESRGIPPGEFRFVPQVTTEEAGFERPT
jgi:glucosamine--fructose-6-phosphate aminotransferase (isomerizing)